MLSCICAVSGAFQPAVDNNAIRSRAAATTTAINMERRDFGRAAFGAAAAALVGATSNPGVGSAQVFFDPAQYGDQELRVAAVDSIRESARRAILKNPALAPSFYQMALLDGISYNAATQEFGPDGSVLKVILTSNADDSYTKNLKEAALSLIEAEKNLRKKNAVSLADAIAVAGAEAIESIGGPVLPVQLGRADTPKGGRVSDIPLDLFSGKYSNDKIVDAFRQAGLTEREMTALLSGLMTLEIVEKTRTTDDWKASARPKFREAGKMGRMSEFKKLTDEDIAQAELDAELEDPDEGWYIADSFGTRERRFGERIGSEDIDEKTFNKYAKQLSEAAKKKKSDADLSKFGWIGRLLLDPDLPTAQTWLTKYAGSYLNFNKDLSASFNSVTQLGAVYTGGKYESLLKDRPRKSLNDDGLNLGF